MTTLNSSLKPVRIVVNDRIKDFTHQILTSLQSTLKMLTEQDIKLTAMDPFLMPVEAYLQAYKKKSIMLKVFAEESFQGELYWFFELNTAILLGSYLRLMTPEARKEKIKTETFDDMDSDSFGEVGNQLCGILDRQFRNLTTKKIHLRLDFGKQVYPDEKMQLDTFINKEEYVVFLATIAIPEAEPQKLTLLLPRSLVEVMLNMELQLEGIAPKNVVLYSWNKDFCASMQKKLNTRYTKVVVANAPDEVLHLAKAANPCAIAIEMETLSTPLAHNDNIFIKRILTNDALQKLPFIFTVADATQSTYIYLQQLGLKAAVPVNLEQAFEPWVRKLLIT